jgi:hypothetical protein
MGVPARRGERKSQRGNVLDVEEKSGREMKERKEERKKWRELRITSVRGSEGRRNIYPYVGRWSLGKVELWNLRHGYSMGLDFHPQP